MIREKPLAWWMEAVAGMPHTFPFSRDAWGLKELSANGAKARANARTTATTDADDDGESTWQLE
jgi:hypothetical protein